MMGWGAFNIDAGEWVRALQVWVHDGVEQGRAGGVAEIAASMAGESETQPFSRRKQTGFDKHTGNMLDPLFTPVHGPRLGLVFVP